MNSKSDSIDDEINKCNIALLKQSQLIKDKISEQAQYCCKKTWKNVSKKYKSSIEECAEFADKVKSYFKDFQNNL